VHRAMSLAYQQAVLAASEHSSAKPSPAAGISSTALRWQRRNTAAGATCLDNRPAP
jgi:hypothetical protein